MGLGERPSDGTLAFAIFFGEPSKSSRGALPNLRAKPFIFCRKLKSESKIGQVLWSKNGQRNLMPRSPDCEPARILCDRGQFSATIFGQFSATILVPKLETEIGKRLDRNRKTAWPKSENGHPNF